LPLRLQVKLPLPWKLFGTSIADISHGMKINSHLGEMPQMYKSKPDNYMIAIERAREAVGKAMNDYSRGGSLTAVNRANRDLQKRA
jgi:hypothetical protein